jgi:membrane protease YdiL (CAAX protease family)
MAVAAVVVVALVFGLAILDDERFGDDGKPLPPGTVSVIFEAFWRLGEIKIPANPLLSIIGTYLTVITMTSLIIFAVWEVARRWRHRVTTRLGVRAK